MTLLFQNHLNPNNIYRYNNMYQLSRMNHSVQKLSNFYQHPNYPISQRPSDVKVINSLNRPSLPINNPKRLVLKIQENETEIQKQSFNKTNKLIKASSNQIERMLVLPTIPDKTTSSLYPKHEKSFTNDINNKHPSEDVGYNLTVNDFSSRSNNNNNSSNKLIKNKTQVNDISIEKEENSVNNSNNSRNSSNENIIHKNNSNYLCQPLNIFPLKFIESHLELELLIDKHIHLLSNKTTTYLESFESFLVKYYRNIKELKLSSRKTENYQLKVFISEGNNKTLFKLFKLQLLFYTSLLLTFRFLPSETFLTQTKNYFVKITKLLSHPFYTLYSTLMQDEYNSSTFIQQFPYIINKFDSLYISNYDLSQNIQNKSSLLSSIENNIDKCIHSFKYFLSLTFTKPPPLKPIIDIYFQYIHLIDINSPFISFMNSFIDIFLYTQIIHSLSYTKISSFINSIHSSPPYLPSQMKPKHKYTLVLDLDETLVHFCPIENKGIFFIRPFCVEFLEILCNYYEIVIFTSATKEYADAIIDSIDHKNKMVRFRLYREHTKRKGVINIKDLRVLGRELEKVVIVDNIAANFSLQPDNGLVIKTWRYDIYDSELKGLMNILIEIGKRDVKDVRVVIREIKKVSDKIMWGAKYSKVDINYILNNINENYNE